MRSQSLMPRYPVPALNVPLTTNGRFVLGAKPGEKFDLLVFYRGLHCPICAKYLLEAGAPVARICQPGRAGCGRQQRRRRPRPANGSQGRCKWRAVWLWPEPAQCARMGFVHQHLAAARHLLALKNPNFFQSLRFTSCARTALCTMVRRRPCHLLALRFRTCWAPLTLQSPKTTQRAESTPELFSASFTRC